MRFLLFILMLCLSGPVLAEDKELKKMPGEYSKEDFCTDSKASEKIINARGPQWLDAITRSDGIKVDCGNETTEFLKFVKLKAAEMPEGWQKPIQAEWNDKYCNIPFIRSAIDHGWKIVAVYTMSDGATAQITAECGI